MLLNCRLEGALPARCLLALVQPQVFMKLRIVGIVLDVLGPGTNKSRYLQVIPHRLWRQGRPRVHRRRPHR